MVDEVLKWRFLLLAKSVFETIISKPNNSAILNTKAEALYQNGFIETIRNRNNLALNYLDKALELNAKSENLEQRSQILLALSTVYEKILDKKRIFGNNPEILIVLIDNTMTI